MLSRNLKVFRYAGILVFVAALCSVLSYPFLKGESARPTLEDLQKEMEQVKSEMEQPTVIPGTTAHYDRLASAISNCGVIKQVVAPTIKAPFAPAANICINGALAVADPDFNRPQAQSTGTGFGPAGSCTLSGTATAANYDVYAFNLTGCAVFPTTVDISLCGPAGCTPPGALDTVITLYRNVPAGDPLTANGGLPAVFNPASPCTNARALNDDSGATPTSAGGSACDQLNPANCPAQCGTSTSLSEMRRTLGSGRFTVVVAGFGNTTVGTYNLYVNAPGAGCNLALSPTAASASVGGRVVNTSGSGISRVEVTISGNGLAQPVTVRTNGFGYYSFDELPVGESYVVTVASKQYTFNPASKSFNLESSISDADFVSEQ
jgi:hypothetical protein